MGCPLEFVMSQGACVVKCPSTYTLQVVSGVPSCVMKSPSGEVITSFGLTSVPPMAGGGPSGAIRNTSYVTWGADFVNAYKDFTEKLAVADAAVSKTTAADTAYRALMKAENARGTPAGESAYETARLAYYTLTQGDSWIEQEKTRIGNIQAQPIMNGLISQYQSLTERKNQQQQTIDVINGLKDKVLSVKDDLSFSVNTFQKQVEAIKNQINKDKKVQSETIQATTSWVDTFLNWTIAIATIVCIFMLVRRFTRGGPSALEKLRADTALFRAQADYTRARAGAPAQPSFLRQLTGTV